MLVTAIVVMWVAMGFVFHVFDSWTREAETTASLLEWCKLRRRLVTSICILWATIGLLLGLLATGIGGVGAMKVENLPLRMVIDDGGRTRLYPLRFPKKVVVDDATFIELDRVFVQRYGELTLVTLANEEEDAVYRVVKHDLLRGRMVLERWL